MRTWLKARTEWKTESWTDWLDFIEKLYSTIVDLFCRYKSDNNTNIVYINRSQWCPWSLIKEQFYYVLDLKATSLYVPAIWFSIAGLPSQHAWMIRDRSKVRLKIGHNIILANIWDCCCKQWSPATVILKLGKNDIIICLQSSHVLSMLWSRAGYARPDDCYVQRSWL